LARDGSAASRVTRRANALVLLDDGWSCQEVADAFLLNDDTVRGWRKLLEQRGIEGLTSLKAVVYYSGGPTRTRNMLMPSDTKVRPGLCLIGSCAAGVPAVIALGWAAQNNSVGGDPLPGMIIGSSLLVLTAWLWLRSG
jgi:hypothetical protein